jgi:hypothetical protein
MHFLKLRLAIERAIRAKGNLGSDPLRIAIVGQEGDKTIQVYIHRSESYEGSAAELENAFNQSWENQHSIYPLNESATPKIQFGIFSAIEFQELISASTSTTLPGYSMSSSRRNDLSKISAEHFKFNIDELNTLLRALQYRVTQMPHSPDFQLCYHPDVSGNLRLTAAIQINSEKNVKSLKRDECTSYAFAELIASQQLGFSFANGPIQDDRQFTTKGESEQKIQLKLDASPVSMQIIRYYLLQHMMTIGLKLSRDWQQISAEKLGLPYTEQKEHVICWDLVFSPDDKEMIDPILTFLKEADFIDCTERISQQASIGKKTNLMNDINKLPQNPMEFIVDKSTEREPKLYIKVNASPESFASIVKTLWTNHPPKANEKNYMKY